MSRQILFSHNEIRKSLPSATDQFIEDYSALKGDLVSLAVSLSPLSGAQNPEGNIKANLSKTFIDTTASPVSVTMYFNKTVGSDTGWVVVV